MAYEMVMPYHRHMPSYFLETFTEYPSIRNSAALHQSGAVSYLFRQLELVYTNSSEVYPLGNARQL